MNRDDIVWAGQLASALEVSAYPKPGNVHRTSDLDGKKFQRFITGSVVIGPSLREAVDRGADAGRGKIEVSDVQIGRAIRDGVNATKGWAGENTNLGTLLLLIPLASAASMTAAKESEFETEKLRENLSDILKSSGSEDALNVYRAISIANAGGMGKVDRLSVREESSKERIAEEDIPLYEIMKISADRDQISKEWVSDMQITFEEGYPLLKELYEKNEALNPAVVQTFLNILSAHPDSFVRRKHGEEIAQETSERAKAVLDKGGMFTREGRKAVDELDESFRRESINPGATADLIASSLMVSFLNGLKDWI